MHVLITTIGQIKCLAFIGIVRKDSSIAKFAHRTERPIFCRAIEVPECDRIRSVWIQWLICQIGPFERFSIVRDCNFNCTLNVSR